MCSKLQKKKLKIKMLFSTEKLLNIFSSWFDIALTLTDVIFRCSKKLHFATNAISIQTVKLGKKQKKFEMIKIENYEISSEQIFIQAAACWYCSFDFSAPKFKVNLIFWLETEISLFFLDTLTSAIKWTRKPIIPLTQQQHRSTKKQRNFKNKE